MIKKTLNISKYITFLIILFSFQASFAQNQSGLAGKWHLIQDESSHLTYYKTILLTIRQKQNEDMRIVMKFPAYYSKWDTLNFIPNNLPYKTKISTRVWPFQIFSGVSMIPDSDKTIIANWVKKDKVLKVNVKYPILVSQGKTKMSSERTFSLSDDGQKLTLTIVQNGNQSNVKKYVFGRGGLKYAYYMDIKKGWMVDSSLSKNAFLISLQGLVNKDSANFYFVYYKDYDYHFTPKMFDFYKHHLGYHFTKINGLKNALKTFQSYINGYIIWDKKARTSLNVAFTLAGLKKAVVITADMVPLMKEYGLKQIADLRNQFRGKTDAEVYKWAFDQYWKKCNHKYIIWMGGVSGKKMMPGIADFGISKGCFFTDLSTDPKDTAEYNLADKILGQMKPLSMVVGWHSYAKDIERQYTTLTSHHGLRVIGLNTFPDLSFTDKTPASPDFKFKNNHNLKPDSTYKPQKKVYITCVQTDGLGLGAWKDSTRGSIPYAWEVTMNWQWMCPALLEYYYSQATKNDFFFGGLSGPGYMYPKAVPKKLLPPLLKTADTLMHKLDLNVFETMDYSQGSTLIGNTELPKYIVDDYYKYMPDAIGFLNGYAPAFTFTSKNGKPFISYDYYLSEKQPVNDAVSDLKTLINLNKKRPYFLVLHVREFNSIKRVKSILSQLGSNVEIVPLDVFFKLAGNNPTFKTRFLEEK